MDALPYSGLDSYDPVTPIRRPGSGSGAPIDHCENIVSKLLQRMRIFVRADAADCSVELLNEVVLQPGMLESARRETCDYAL